MHLEKEKKNLIKCFIGQNVSEVEELIKTKAIAMMREKSPRSGHVSENQVKQLFGF